MEQQKLTKINTTIFILGAVAATCVCINLLFLVLIGNTVNTVTLLKNQVVQQREDKELIASSEELLTTYKDDMDIITEAFPNEQTILTFIQTLERSIREDSDEYSFKFNSLTPIVEGDKQYLLMTITMKSDFTRIEKFLGALEKMPYLTHVTSISTKTPGTLTDKGDTTIRLKIYVQNPFSTK